MREIIFDTETTGLDNRQDRVIEIGGIELDNHFPTGRTFHVFISPGDRKVHPDALAIHGISDEFLKVWRASLAGEGGDAGYDFNGKHIQVKGAKTLYPPVQKPYPPLSSSWEMRGRKCLQHQSPPYNPTG